MSGPTAREQIAAQIKTDNPSMSVIAYGASAPENLGAGKVRVSVYRTRLDVTAHLTHVMQVEVIVAGVGTAKAEDDLDAALDKTLASLQRMDVIRVTSAERAIFDDKFIGYTINAEVDSVDVYRELIAQERSN